MGYNSTIITKRKHLKCGHYDFAFSKGRCKQCATIADTNKRVSKHEETEGGAELTRWFNDRRKEMKGFCKHCGEKTQKNNDNFKCSIAHILPKAYFPSVATNEHNWVELCFYNNSCHTNFDNHMIDIIELNCFDEVIEKFKKMYPSIDVKERRRIPSILLQYLET